MLLLLVIGMIVMLGSLLVWVVMKLCIGLVRWVVLLGEMSMIRLKFCGGGLRYLIFGWGGSSGLSNFFS